LLCDEDGVSVEQGHGHIYMACAAYAYGYGLLYDMMFSVENVSRKKMVIIFVVFVVQFVVGFCVSCCCYIYTI